jgi:hypothetical protein
MKNTSPAKTILLSLGIVFVLLLAYFLTPFPMSVKQSVFPFVAVLGLIFLILGVVLAIAAKKEKGKKRTFLMLTGISAAAPFVFSVLHNLFYGLAEMFERLKCVFEPLHAASFIIALIIAPITFVIGVAGSIVLLKREKRTATGGAK